MKWIFLMQNNNYFGWMSSKYLEWYSLKKKVVSVELQDPKNTSQNFNSADFFRKDHYLCHSWILLLIWGVLMAQIPTAKERMHSRDLLAKWDLYFYRSSRAQWDRGEIYTSVLGNGLCRQIYKENGVSFLHCNIFLYKEMRLPIE